MGMVVGRGTAASIGVLLVDPLIIKLGQTVTVAPIEVDGDGGGRGNSGCVLHRICSGVRTGDAVIYAGIPIPKSMTVP
jgi:hypothetical protein